MFGEVGKISWIPRNLIMSKGNVSRCSLSDRDGDVKKDWDDCIVAIDDKGRELKCKLKKQLQQDKQ